MRLFGRPPSAAAPVEEQETLCPPSSTRHRARQTPAACVVFLRRLSASRRCWCRPLRLLELTPSSTRGRRCVVCFALALLVASFVGARRRLPRAGRRQPPTLHPPHEAAPATPGRRFARPRLGTRRCRARRRMRHQTGCPRCLPTLRRAPHHGRKAKSYAPKNRPKPEEKRPRKQSREDGRGLGLAMLKGVTDCPDSSEGCV